MPSKSFLNTKTLVIFLSISIIHILFSYAISIHYGIIAGSQVNTVITTALKENDFTQSDIEKMHSNFEQSIKTTYYLAVVLSLPFGPIIDPVRSKWVTQPLLKKEIGKKEFYKRGRILGIIQSISNAIIFSLFVLGVWKIVRNIQHTVNKEKNA